MDMAHLRPLAADLAEQAGLGAVTKLSPATSGGHNRVYVMDCTSGGTARRVLLKQYFRGVGDRDRLGSEFAFLLYASARGLAVPKLIACDQENGLGAYEFVAGRGLEPGNVTASHVGQALDFLVRLNLDRKGAQRLQTGAESCFTPAAHLHVVDRRLLRLKDVTGEAGAFIKGALFSEWVRVREKAAARMKDMPDLAPDQCMVSPSDFGFHNAIMNESGKLTFIDFEYAGWDDPAKAVCDFFCQPAVPAPRSEMDRFTAALAGQSWADDRLADRVAALLPVYEVTWVTIMLNEFLPAGTSRRVGRGPHGHIAGCRWPGRPGPRSGAVGSAATGRGSRHVALRDQ